MNDKERLQRIKEDVSFWEYCVKNTHYCELVSHDIEKIKWLIERVEQLQQENEKEQKRLKNQIYKTVEEKFLLEKQLRQAQAKAERYEKALREIANEQEVGEGDFNAADVANNLIATAKEALGDES